MRKALGLFIFFLIACNTNSPKSDSCGEGRRPSSAGTCEAIFSDSEITPQNLSLANNYDHLGLEELRLGPVQNGSYPILRQKVYGIPVKNAWLTSQIIEPGWKKTTMSFAASPMSESMFQQNQALWSQRIQEAMDFVLNQYAERREHWPASFREKLRKMAEDYRANSTYIEVKNEDVNTKETKMLGTLRLIEERNGKLPMEDYLGITINSHGAKKFEPGNFAIDKSVNQYTFGEILVHLIESILDKSKNQESHFYTYADRQSLAMYKMLGFKPVNPKDLTLAAGVTLDEKGRITANDVAWTPLQASREDLQALLNHYLSGELQNHDASRVREVMRRRNQAVTTHGVFQDVIFRGQMKHSNGEVEPCALYIRPKDGRKTFMFGKTKKQSLMFRGWESFSIPDQNLADGFHETRPGESVDYHQGVLTYRQTDDSGTYVIYEIRISPDLSTVDSVHAIYNPGKDFQTEFTGWF